MPYERPKIVINPPGPKAKALVEKDEQLLSPSLTRSSQLVGARAEGVYIEDIDGNVFLDFGSGIAVAGLGHRHPKVIERLSCVSI